MSPSDPLVAFRGGLVLVIAFFAAAGVVSAVLLTRRPVAAPAPAPAPAPVPSPSAEVGEEIWVRAPHQTT